MVEAAFLVEEGLVDRPFYRHVLIAPDAESGYDPVPLPEIRAAVASGDAAAIARATGRARDAIARAAGVLGSALRGTGK